MKAQKNKLLTSHIVYILYVFICIALFVRVKLLFINFKKGFILAVVK